jgi:hypothetical protein
MGLKLLWVILWVELASASTDEPKADRDLQARALKDAGTAPLFYALHFNDNLPKFMSLSDKVGYFLVEDSHVSQKLFEIRNKIELLKETKEKGNFEVSTIKQAKVLNEKGVNKKAVGNIEMNKIQ